MTDGAATSGNRPIVELAGVSHTFVDARTRLPVDALAPTTMSVEAGEFVSIVGPSGCGKTTILNVVAGLIKPTTGLVTVNGKAVTGPQPDILGYMFARDTLLPWRTVIGNARLGLELRRTRGADAATQALLEQVGLKGFETAYPDQLSHGMRQRVALARTLAPNPQILLMDEPFGALDAQTRLLMQEQFLDLWERDRKTVLFVTHDLEEALLLSDRVIVMSARPGYLKAIYPIDWPRPRVIDELRQFPAFNQMYRQIWHDLKHENAPVDAEQSIA